MAIETSALDVGSCPFVVVRNFLGIVDDEPANVSSRGLSSCSILLARRILS